MIEDGTMAIETSDPIRKEVEHRLEAIEPNQKVLKEVLYSAEGLKQTLTATKPDVIIVSGNSGSISKMFVENSQALDPDTTIVKLSPEEVTSMYEAANSGNRTSTLTEICKAKGISSSHRIEIVDDFLDSGNKAGKLLHALDIAGVQSSHFTALAASPESQPNDDRITLLNQDPTLYEYMDNLARTISISNKPDQMTEAYNPYKDAMVFKSIGALSTLRSHINQNL